jgi:hypothetical protein
MPSLLRGICLIGTLLAGLWFGFAAPFFVFLTTGVHLAVVLALAFAAFGCGFVLNERRSPPGARGWLRGLIGGAACGVLLQFLFVLAGGWSFGS